MARAAGSLQALPEEALQRLEDAGSLWNVGWSRGREALADGRPDVHKASFYANPLDDRPDADAIAAARFPSYCRCGAARVWSVLHTGSTSLKLTE